MHSHPAFQIRAIPYQGYSRKYELTLFVQGFFVCDQVQLSDLNKKHLNKQIKDIWMQLRKDEWIFFWIR